MAIQPYVCAYETASGIRYGVYVQGYAGLYGAWLRGKHWEPVPLGKARIYRSLFKTREAAECALRKANAP